jgi:hypothetical protein
VPSACLLGLKQPHHNTTPRIRSSCLHIRTYHFAKSNIHHIMHHAYTLRENYSISNATMGLSDTMADNERSLPLEGNTSPLLTPTDPVDDNFTTTAPSLDTTSLQTSKHHPDFRIRNQLKIVKIVNVLSDLHMHLSATQKTQDQSALDDLLARTMKAGEGLANLAKAMPTKEADSVARKMDGAQMSEVCKCMDSSGWYRIEQEGAEGGSEIGAHFASLD